MFHQVPEKTSHFKPIFHEVPKKYETNNSQQHFINNPQNVGAERNVHIFLACRHSQQMSHIV
jgi:hypothetical protein